MSNGKRIFHVAYLFDGADRVCEDCEVFLDQGVLVKILEKKERSEESEKFRETFKDAETIHEPQGFMLPGLINAHHHAYSALARGIPLIDPMPDFEARLEKLWWRLDRALDEEAIRLSASVTAMECIRHGCTAVIDHHSSPSAISGSLEALAKGFDPYSMTCVLCYETSDRNGPAAVDQAMAENLAFIQAHDQDPGLRGLFGLHASFTLTEETLKRVAREKSHETGIHIHVAEDRCDGSHARSLGYEGPLQRLHHHGLLNEKSLIAHGVHLADSEYDLVKGMGLRVAHNPESNANNRVGYADLDRLPAGQRCLGTDGMSSNLLGSLRFAYLLYSALGRQGQDKLALCRDLLFNGSGSYLSCLFGREVGRIREGAPADFALFPYPAPTAVDPGNLMSHLIYGLGIAPKAQWVYARGTPVLEAGVVKCADEAALLTAARERSQSLWIDTLAMD